jgi:hypothetical protein
LLPDNRSHWLHRMQSLGYQLEYESAVTTSGMSTILLVNPTQCDAVELDVATTAPQGVPFSTNLNPSVVGAPYTTGVVVAVGRSTPGHFITRLVDQCMHFLRQGTHVVLVPAPQARAQAGGASAVESEVTATLRNLERTYRGSVTVLFPAVSDPQADGYLDGEAVAWNTGVSFVVHTLHADVVLLLNDAAVLGHDVLYLTDAAATTQTGPLFPMTNAPRRGSTFSPQV